MATLTIKNIPDSLYRQLKEKAQLNHRSINSEVIVSLEEILQKKVRSTQDLLLKARNLRIKENKKIRLTNRTINSAKQRGRE